jgi:DNA-binding NarL/FixJ family response regulator
MVEERMAACLVLSDDLIDGSRVTGHARATGIDARHCRDLPTLLAAIMTGPRLVVLDLHFPGLDVAAVVAACEAHAPPIKVIGYGSHVDASRLKAARQAGCTEVLPRSAFFDGLEARLQGWTQ